LIFSNTFKDVFKENTNSGKLFARLLKKKKLEKWQYSAIYYRLKKLMNHYKKEKNSILSQNLEIFLLKDFH
jgi:hypothetical protein